VESGLCQPDYGRGEGPTVEAGRCDQLDVGWEICGIEWDAVLDVAMARTLRAEREFPEEKGM